MKKRIISCLSMAIAGCLMVSTPVFAQGDDPEAVTETLEENPGDAQVTTEESSDPLSFDGTGTVVDNVQQGSKQFYTISTDAGNVFYLIIDLDKDSNNVYFLDTTKERDLLALAEQAEAEASGTTTTETQATSEKENVVTEADSTSTEETTEKEETTEDEAKKQQQQTSSIPWGMLVIVLIAGVGVVVYYWIIKPKKDREEAEEFEETFDFMDDEITPDDSYEEEDTYGRIGGDDE